ncbi:ATP-binding protein [Candidatus Woesearchaeota archaeon]|nr:ATP-binding protein [Candidatus Woesearchaeota archaeon]
MITKSNLGEIIKDFHEKDLPHLIKRSLNIPDYIPLRRSISLIGPRRSGKTFRLFQVITELINNGIEKTRLLYINFERAELEGITGKDILVLIDTFFEIYPDNEKKKCWVFFDEIQVVDGWENSVRTLIDNERLQLFLSGSSSKLLSREIATSMRGRTLTYTIFPLSFLEYLHFKSFKIEKYLSKSGKRNLLSHFRNYLEKGGYPEVALYEKEREKIHRDIVETTIVRDVIERYKIRNIKLLRILINTLINSIAREFSVHKFYNFVKSQGIKASKDALYNYVDALNDVFFAFPLRKFSYSYREKEQSLPKMYIIDNGLLTINGIKDMDKLMENLVFIELLRKNKEVYYHKSSNAKETDFVVIENKKVKELIQVCCSLEELSTKERELKSLLKASKELKCNNLLVITEDKEGEEKIKNKKIKFIPLWKWLLQV